MPSKLEKALNDYGGAERRREHYNIEARRAAVIALVREMLDCYEARLYRRVESAFTDAGAADVPAAAWPKAFDRLVMRDAILNQPAEDDDE